MALTQKDQDAIVTAHNAYRSDPTIHAPSLKWDSNLATGAQSWADYLASTVHDLKHSDSSSRPGQGENIAMGSTGNYTAAQMVDFWGKTVISGSSEQGNFKPGTFPDTSKTGNWADSGHYTQVIWNDTVSVGCGMASDGTNDYLVCRYSPAGNVAGVQVPKPSS